MSTKRPRKQRGFTLIEVVAAFLLASFGLLLVYEIWNGAISRSILTNQREDALAIAQSLVDEQRVLRVNSAGTTSGTANQMNWTVTRQEYGPPSTVPGIEWRPMKIDVEVKWNALVGQQSISLERIVLVINV